MKKFIALFLIVLVTFSLCACSPDSPVVIKNSADILETPLTAEFTVVEKYVAENGSVPSCYMVLKNENYTLFMEATYKVFAMLQVGDVCQGEVVLNPTTDNPTSHTLTTNVGRLHGNLWRIIPVE